MKSNEFRSCRSRAAVSIVLCLLLSGCATMFAPSHDTITIKTDPEGADVYDGATLLGKTPLTQSFKRDTFVQKTLQIRMSGYRTQDLQLGRTLDNVSLWNFGYFLTTMGGTCWLIDASNGNMIKYAPDSYLIDLEKNGAPRSKDQAYRDRLRFVVMNHAGLSKDIAGSDSGYLRAYFEMSAKPSPPPGEYEHFRSALAKQAIPLLSNCDPVQFFYALEAGSRSSQ